MAPQTQPLNKRILLSRPLEDSKRIAPDFERLGYAVVISPVLHIKQLDVTLPEHDIICLSSKNALPALKNISKKTPIFCVGHYTQQCLRVLGFQNITHATTAQKLLPQLAQQSGKVLYLAGEVATLDFSAHLPQCQKLICYEAIAVDTLKKEISHTSITHIPFYSLRSAQLLHKLLIKNKLDLKGITALALSTDIANAIKDFDFKEI